MRVDELFHPDERREVATAVVELRADLQRAIDRLLDEGALTGYDLILLTLWMDGYSFREMGALLDEPHSTVQTRFERACRIINQSGLLRGYEV